MRKRRLYKGSKKWTKYWITSGRSLYAMGFKKRKNRRSEW